MIETGRGNLLDADVEALVNTVNTVGVMGKGIALQFRKAFPDNYKAYEKACAAGQVVPGRMFIFDRQSLQNPRYIINFPTKRHWRGRSRIEDIDTGLAALVEDVRRLGIQSIALPPLGCGHGGLNWSDVRPRIEHAFAELTEVRVVIFAPGATPAAEKMPNKTKKPRMTVGRAAILGLMHRYTATGYEYLLSLLEVQKLAYFLQLAGENLKLDFAKGLYGPYADKLRHVLNNIEGHYIIGIGDANNKPQTPIALVEGSAEAAEQFLLDHPATRERFDRVARLIEGFETPYGMELLSTVHWAVTRELRSWSDNPGVMVEAVTTEVHAWNLRKKDMMRREHIGSALTRLQEQGWICT
jgi:O-acetyl-ADP-ribose deacetylase (regulator of RNase III)